MSIGFRKSLLGFNCNDVIEYIEKTHKTFISKEKSLNTKVEGLLTKLASSKAQEQLLLEQNAELSKKLDEFNAKYDEIERLSENIGKLYLVAQSNAKTIMDNSQNSAQISLAEVERNLYSIDQAHESLKELRQSIAKTSEDFVGEVNKLLSSLNETREQIAANTETAHSASEEFKAVLEAVSK